MSLQRHDPRTGRSGVGIWPVLAIGLLISLYPILRYDGWWNPGNDTRNITVAVRSVLERGALAPEGMPVYPNGYGFQALSAFLLKLGGLDLANWQLYGSVLLTVWMVFPAWLLYRELVGSSRGATLATMILLTQPELLFGIMRGTHEKFTRGLILLCIFLLVYSVRSRHNPSRFAAAVLAFYLSSYALITFNNLFSGTFFAAVVLALGLAWALAWRTSSFDLFAAGRKRMGYIAMVSPVLVFLYSFYAYSPAVENLSFVKSIADRVAALFVETEAAETFNPYTGPVFRAWVSPHAFFVLGLANWLLALGSGSIWAWLSVRWLLGGRRPSGDAELLLWAFYGAFGFLGAMAIVADISGAVTGNLQHRMFPSISLMGAPLIARGLLPILEAERRVVARLAHTGLVAGIGLLSLLALMKATNEPMVSNQWQAYLPAETSAIAWAERNLADRSIWIGFDRRMLEVTDIRSGGKPRQLILDRFEVEPETHDFLISDLLRLQAPRLGGSLPTQPDDLVTFDNGQAQVHHRRPQSPYHR